MLDHKGFRRFWGHRRRGLLAVGGTVLALTGIAMALAPPQSSQAAEGQKSATGVPYAGYLTTNTGQCSVTVVSEWLAITAKGCGTGKPKLKLNVADVSNTAEYQVKSITPNPTKDVEAIFLQKRTGLTVMPLRATIARDRFSAWGYGLDHSNQETNHLTRADFNPADFTLTDACPIVVEPPREGSLEPSRGSLCWPTTATNNVCLGDAGGPVTQNGAIIGMLTDTGGTSKKPDGKIDCSKVIKGQALTVRDMQPWLDQMIKDADPFD